MLLGFCLIAVGVGFLILSYSLPGVHKYLILGGLLWFMLGGTIIIADVVVDHKKKKLGRAEVK